jgi:hypothetical protein
MKVFSATFIIETTNSANKLIDIEGLVLITYHVMRKIILTFYPTVLFESDSFYFLSRVVSGFFTKNNIPNVPHQIKMAATI